MTEAQLVSVLLKTFETDKFYKRSTAILRLDSQSLDGRGILDSAEGEGWLEYYAERDEIVFSAFSWVPTKTGLVSPV